MSKTYLKLNDEWLGLLQDVNQQIAEDGSEALTAIAKEYAEKVISDNADEYEFESALHFFSAIYFIWRKDPKVTRIKLKAIDKLASSMMDTVTELTNNPDKRNQFEVTRFLKDKANSCL